MWCLIHDNINIIDLFEKTTGTTDTIQQVYQANTKTACLKEIINLNLLNPYLIDLSNDSRIVTNNEFIRKLTPNEWLLCLNKAYSGDETARLIIFTVQSTTGIINLDDQITINYMLYWVSTNCITAERMTKILS